MSAALASVEPAKILTAQPSVFDRSHWGRIRLTGADRVRFLHNQTTNNIERLSAGAGCRTVFVTSTGRTIDLASVYATPEALFLVVSPGMAQLLYDWMDRYIFFSDKVTLQDKTAQTFMFTVLGEGADDVVRSLGADALIGQPEFTHQSLTLPGVEQPVTIAVGSDLAIAGYTLWGTGQRTGAAEASPENSPEQTPEQTLAQAKEQAWQALCVAGAAPSTPDQWEQLRIQQGRPMPACELTDDDNPLESGLWDSISFEKGCYIGQETIARLNTYQGVKKRLWGIILERPLPVGTALTVAGNKVGKLTSVAHLRTGTDATNDADTQTFGLAYIRTKAGGPALTVEIDDTTAQVVTLPFITHEYYTPDK
ncbi:MAG: folate-binding protein [Phormidesmis sp.]